MLFASPRDVLPGARSVLQHVSLLSERRRQEPELPLCRCLLFQSLGCSSAPTVPLRCCAGRESLPSAAGAPERQHPGNDRGWIAPRSAGPAGAAGQSARVRPALHPSFPCACRIKLAPPQSWRGCDGWSHSLGGHWHCTQNTTAAAGCGTRWPAQHHHPSHSTSASKNLLLSPCLKTHPCSFPPRGDGALRPPEPRHAPCQSSASPARLKLPPSPSHLGQELRSQKPETPPAWLLQMAC